MKPEFILNFAFTTLYLYILQITNLQPSKYLEQQNLMKILLANLNY